MKHTKRLLAMLLALVLMITPIIPVQAAQTMEVKDDTLYFFDLEKFITSIESTECQYDYLKLATALQGLVNRDEPRLFFDFMEHDNYGKKFGMDMDKWWLDQLRMEDADFGLLKNGKDLADYQIVTVKRFWDLMDMFSSYYNGFVLWDEKVPATANVASTIAGVEDLLPVRFSASQKGDDVYLQLLKHGFKRSDFKRDLCGLFTGEGYIPTLGSSVTGAKIEYTDTPSTKSIKNDPYVWAKMFYMDTGLTNPLLNTYSIDANRTTWPSYITNPNPAHADFLDAVLPTVMQPNEVRMFQITFENTGTQAWEANSFCRLGIEPEEVFRIYPDTACKQSVTSKNSRITLTKDVAPGEEYTFTGYLKAPRQTGDYKLTFVMVIDGEANISSRYTQEISVKRGGTEEIPYEPFRPTETPDYETADVDAQILHANIPSSAAVNAALRLQAAVKNIGTENWAANACKLAITFDGKTTYIPMSAGLDAGESVSLTADVAAPATAGAYDVELQVVDANGDAIGEAYSASVAVGAAGELGCTVASFTYPSVIRLGEKATAVLEVVNTGEKAWSLNGADGSVKAKLISDSSIDCISLPGAANDTNLLSELNFEGGIVVKPGEHYLFHFDLHTCIGTTPLAEVGERISMALSLAEADGSTFGAEIPLSFTVVPQDMENGKSITPADEAIVDGTGLDAELIEVCLPKTLYKGEYTPFYYTVKNTGDITWKPYKQNFLLEQPLLGIAPESAKAGEAGVDRLVELYHSDLSTQGSRKSRMRIQNGVEVAPGECYTFFGYMYAAADAKECEKEYTLALLAEGIGGSSVATYKWNLSIEPSTALNSLQYLPSANEVLSGVSEMLPEADEAVKAATSLTTITQKAGETALVAELISDNVPDQMKAGESVQLAITVKNVGTGTWYANDIPQRNNRLRIVNHDNASGASANMATQFNFARHDANGQPYTWSLGRNYDMGGSGSVAVGGEYTYRPYLHAPTTPGTYTFTIAVNNSNGAEYYRDAYTKTITVVGDSSTENGCTADNMTQIVKREASTYIAEYVSSNIPDTMAPGEVVTIQLNFKNAGSTSFYTCDSANKNIRVSVPDYNKSEAFKHFGLSLVSGSTFAGDCELPGNHEI
ncbi:MAG: hypothetical protein IIY04_04530, partial [Oscillospiraceae bacterium]|nr:hypothetical protein [Oscillospiraceae bacterium]